MPPHEPPDDHDDPGLCRAPVRSGRASGGGGFLVALLVGGLVVLVLVACGGLVFFLGRSADIPVPAQPGERPGRVAPRPGPPLRGPASKAESGRLRPEEAKDDR